MAREIIDGSLAYLSSGTIELPVFFPGVAFGFFEPGASGPAAQLRCEPGENRPGVVGGRALGAEVSLGAAGGSLWKRAFRPAQKLDHPHAVRVYGLFAAAGFFGSANTGGQWFLRPAGHPVFVQSCGCHPGYCHRRSGGVESDSQGAWPRQWGTGGRVSRGHVVWRCRHIDPAGAIGLAGDVCHSGVDDLAGQHPGVVLY